MRGRGGGRYRRPPSSITYYNYSYGYGSYEDDSETTKHKLSGDYSGKTQEASADDSRILKQLKRLKATRKENIEKFFEYKEQLQQSIVLPDNKKYVKRNVEIIMEGLFENFYSSLPKSCKWEVARCCGHVGVVVENEVEKFIRICLSQLNMSETTEEKVLVLRCIFHFAELDTDGRLLTLIGQELLERLHGVLETTDVVEVMVCIIDTFKKIHNVLSNLIAPYFEDLVDILIGWHIDSTQSSAVITYVSLSLQSFNQLWRQNVQFAVTLLTQFIEDMEEYFASPNEEILSRETLEDAQKFSAFIGVFTTTVRCLDSNLTPNLLPQSFFIDLVSRVIDSVCRRSYDPNVVLSATNQLCVALLNLNLLNGNVDRTIAEVTKLIVFHHNVKQRINFIVQLSYLQLLKKILEVLGMRLPLTFVHLVLDENSVLNNVFMSPQINIWKEALAVFHAIFALKNVPLVQDAYRIILKEMQKCVLVLVPNSSPIPISPTKYYLENLVSSQTSKEADDSSTETKKDEMTAENAEIILSYYITVLAEVANARNSIISMWALSPSLVDLLSLHIAVTSPLMTKNHSQVQEKILFLLYSHSSKHSHYINSSSLLIGDSSTFSPPTFVPFNEKPLKVLESSEWVGYVPDASLFSSSSTSGANFGNILKTIMDIFNMRTFCGKKALKLCIDWTSEIIKTCASWLPILMKKKQFRSVTEAFLKLGYHINDDVASCLAGSLRNFVNSMPGEQVNIFEEVIELALYNISHQNVEIRKLYFEILSQMPLSYVINVKMRKSSAEAGKSDSYRTSDGMESNPETMISVLRQYTLGTKFVPPIAFKTIMEFLLDSSKKGWKKMDNDSEKEESSDIDENCLVDLFLANGGYLNSQESFNFSVLCPKFKILLWKWLTDEAASHCVYTKLRTVLGKPHDTFTAIEQAVKCLFIQLRNCDERNTHNRFKLSENTKLELQNSPCEQLAEMSENSNQVISTFLVIQFIENLEKAMFSASDGCAIASNSINKSVRIFFSTNRQTCVEWLTRIRTSVISVALNCGQPYAALRHSFKLIQELLENNKTHTVDFERVLCYCVKAFICIGCEEAVLGLHEWAELITGKDFAWIKISASSAAQKYERALEGYGEFYSTNDLVEENASKIKENLLQYDKNQSEIDKKGKQKDKWMETESNEVKKENAFDFWKKDCDPFIKEFILHQISQCYTNLGNYDKLKMMSERLNDDFDDSIRISGDLNTFSDLSYIEALSTFDSCDLEQFKTNESFNSCSNVAGRGCVWPIWKLEQNLDKDLASILGAVVNKREVSDSNIDLCIKNCEHLVQNCLQISQVDPYPNYQIKLIFYLQLLYQLKSLRNNEKSESNFYEKWENVSLHSVPFSLLPRVSSCSTILSSVQEKITEASVTKLNILTAKHARKKENYQFAESKLCRLIKNNLENQGIDISEEAKRDRFPLGSLENILNVSSSREYSILTSKLRRESAKLLAETGRVKEGCQVLSDIVCTLNCVLATLASKGPSLLTLPPNEAGHICARSILTLNKWLEKEKSVLIPDNKKPDWLNKMDEIFNQMKPYSPNELNELSDLSGANLPLFEDSIGHLLTLATIQCPTLPKVWFHVASWAFKWGQHAVSRDIENCDILNWIDVESIRDILQKHREKYNIKFSESQFEEIITLMNESSKSGEDFKTEDILRLEEIEGSHHLSAALSHIFTEWGLKEDIISNTVSSLLQIRCDALKRNNSILNSCAKAYFKFLKLGTGVSGHSDYQMIATLRLLRLIVKHASELQEVLENGLKETPTTPWKPIIPQLFGRLNHLEPYVRRGISELLCRLAKNYSHLIIFPAVVGASSSGSSRKHKTSVTEIFAYFDEKDKTRFKEIGDNEDLDNYDKDLEEENTINENKDDTQRTLMQNCFSILINTLKKEMHGSIAEVQTLIHELRRITLLWDELWLGTLNQHDSELNKKCNQLKLDIKYLNKNATFTAQDKSNLIQKKFEIVFRPIVFVLDQLSNITSASPQTPHERKFQDTFSQLIKEARQKIVNSYEKAIVFENSKKIENLDPFDIISKYKLLHQTLQQRAQKRSSTTLKMSDISPTLVNLTDTKIAMPGVELPSSETINIANVGATILILPTKTKPKKLNFKGSDGRQYTYLFKGLEDLHLDQRIMQFLATVNTMISKNHRKEISMYRAQYYSVVPLGSRSGLIQWVGNATPLFGLYRRWHQREAQQNVLKSINLQSISRPSDLFYKKLGPKLASAGISIENRKDWPVNVVEEVYEELVKETPADLLSRELWQTSISTSEWWNITQRYNISTAVMAVIGYIIGLGDRHLDNLLVNLTTGEIVHIDYNVCFEKGKNLKVPETVPYRMTQNIENALGISGVHGIFKDACEHVLEMMRSGKETLLTLLEAFIYDPLVDWTPESESGYAGAVYGGDQSLVLEVRQKRKQLEKNLTLSMFTVILTEMKREWLINKGNILKLIPEILIQLQKWQITNEGLIEAENRLQEGHQLLSMVKEAESNPESSLYELQNRYKEYIVVKNSKETAEAKLTSKIEELQEYKRKYIFADQSFKSGYLSEMRSKFQNVKALVSCAGLVFDYLSTAGQSQLALQCNENENDMNKSVADLANVCLNALEPLQEYANIWSNYPANHLENHRIWKHLSALKTVSQDLKLETVQKVIEKSSRKVEDISDSVSELDFILQSKIIKLKAQRQKIYEIMQSEGLSSGANVLSSYQLSLASVTSLSNDHGATGEASIVCALLNALAQALNVRLRDDKSVAEEKRNLLDMKIGNLWWLTDCVVSLSTIWDIVCLLSKYSAPVLSSEATVFKTMSIIHETFTVILDLINNSRHIIVVEGGRLLGIKEPTVVKMARRLKEFTEEPGMISGLLEKLDHHLHRSVFRMHSLHPNVVKEADDLHSNLLNLIQQITDTSFNLGGESNASGATVEMNQGQMLLMGFHLLFETVDEKLDRLINNLALAPLPHPWPRIDTIKMSTELMGPVLDSSITEVVRAILKVKKVEVYSQFFSRALKYYCDESDLHTDNVEENLCRYVKMYASECVTRLLLGLPSYLSTYIILLQSQKLGVDVTGYIEARDIGTEGLVPLESLVEHALEMSITGNGLQVVIGPTATTVSNHMVNVRRKLLLRQYENDVEGVKILQERVTFQRVSHSWFYEEEIKEKGRGAPLEPNKATILSNLKGFITMLKKHKVKINEYLKVSETLSANVNHRLKWAAGSNPEINVMAEKYNLNFKNSNSFITKILKLSDDVSNLCEAAYHYEEFRTNSSVGMSEDNNFMDILIKSKDACQILDGYSSKVRVSPKEELLISITKLPNQITPFWVKKAAVKVSDYLTKLTISVSEQATSLKDIEGSVKDAIDELRQELTPHHKLMSDVRILLKNLAKFEQEGGLQGIDGYLCLYRRYSEVMYLTIRQVLHESLHADKIIPLNQKFHQLLLQTHVIYDKLLEFGVECNAEKSTRDESLYSTSDRSTENETRRDSGLVGLKESILTGTRGMSMKDSRSKKHPVTGKAYEERNPYALNAWKRIKIKLEGKDLDSSKTSSVKEQVEYTIQQAKDVKNLAALYEGWTSWV